MNHAEVYSDKCKDKKDIWVDYVKTDVLCTAFVTLDILKQWKKSLDLA